MKAKKIVQVLAVLILVIILAFSVWKIFLQDKDKRPMKILVKLPNGEVVEAVRAPAINPAVREALTSASIDGKVEELAINPSEKDSPTRIVLITNDGKLVILMNPQLVNGLRFGGYVGKIVKLKGRWFGEISFRGRVYKSFWIDKIA